MPEDVHPAAVGHADVEDQQLPGAFPEPLERLLAGRGLADLADGVVLSEQLPETRANDRMVVGNQNSRCHHEGLISLKDNPKSHMWTVSGSRICLRRL